MRSKGATTAGTTGGLFRSGDTDIDTVRGIIRRNGQETYLRAKTQQLLQCLIANRTGPVSKEELLRQVWEGVSVSDATVFGCMQELRKALGDDAREPVFIRTMAKKGYWFVATLEETDAEPVADIERDPPSVSAPPPPAVVSRRRWRYGLIFVTVAVGGLLLLARLRQSAEAESSYEEIAWWKLEEGSGREIRDSVGGLAGLLPSGATWTSGVAGNALRFDGNRAFVTGIDPGTLPRGLAPRSLAAWIRTDSTNADSTFILGQGDFRSEPPGHSFNLFLWGDGRAAVWSGPTTPVLGPRVDDGRWHHLVGVFEGAATRRAWLYVDGFESGSAMLPETASGNGKSRGWAIAGLPWGGTSFRGSIGDVRIYDRPLTAPEVFALHRCGGPTVDASGGYFFAPIFGNSIEIAPAGEGESSSRIRNSGTDHAGVDFVARRDGCSVQSLRGADLGQNLRIGMDLRIGGSAAIMGEGGPYFRSRKSAPGDGIVGGASAGYWVQLQSDGRVRVRRLHPDAVVAFTRPIAGFEANAFHRLIAEAVREKLTVTLDGAQLTFDEGGKNVTEVSIPPVWETESPRGSNRGTGGIAFSCYLNRGKLTGQEARNIFVERIADR